MPQPAEVAELAEQILAVFRAAQVSLDAEIARLVGTPATRRLVRARELRGVVEEEMARVEAATAEWIGSSFPSIYEMGGAQGAVATANPFAWSQVHAGAVSVLAQDTWGDVLQATRLVRADVKAWIRTEGRRQASLSLEGRTAQQAARALVKEAAAGDVVAALGGPIGVVRYADGSYRRLADYADMLLRTKVAVTFNAGTLGHLDEAGVGWVECFDGTGCGFSSHESPDKANGTIRTLAEARAHPLSHPRCRRSFGGRPDITSQNAAKKAEPTTTVAQREDQAESERERAERIERAASSRRKREARVARQPRAAR